MKKLLVIAIIVLIAALAGWVTFGRTPGRAFFVIETQKMKDDARSAIEKGKDMGKDLLQGEKKSEPISTQNDPGPKN